MLFISPSMNIPRIYAHMENLLQPNKALILFGPRQVGKTTLLEKFLSGTPLKYRLENGEDALLQELAASHNFSRIRKFCEGYEVIAIDEAQRAPGIGEMLKIIVDHIPGIRVIATGSSSFELSGQVGEPLTGRKNEVLLFPVSQMELRNAMGNDFDLENTLEERLIFGSYPEVVVAETESEKRARIQEITQSYLLKDILNLERVKGSKVLLDVLRLLAFQVGDEVSLPEVASGAHIDVKTLDRYLDLFEKSFILFNLRGFSRNLRSEITRKSKYFFYDTGVRNAIINNFNPLSLRSDIGALWENFIFMERLKKRAYSNISANTYFWRTYEQKEIDLVEERDGKLFGYEMKWSEARAVKTPRLWTETYPEASFDVINRRNYLDFVG